jgi:N-acetylglucosaminyldiphosphoundecaprenol N-acetyl-beta-D-mannosaminyltransferase
VDAVCVSGPVEPARGIARVNILGVGVSAIDMSQALEAIECWLDRREQHYVCVTGVHGIMESQRDGALRRIHNQAGLVTPDGVPLVWLSWLAGQAQVEQVCGSDLMLACCQRSVVHGYRHFFYGGGEGVAQRLVARLCSQCPGLTVAGTFTPPFRPLTPAEDDAIARKINDVGAEIVWVGLSTPKQERWMAAHVNRLHAPVMIGVGAAFDFHAGLKRRAPLWMRRSGLEWLFRLGTEPRRLWRRYLMNNPAFVWRVLLQAAGIAQYEIRADRERR